MGKSILSHPGTARLEGLCNIQHQNWAGRRPPLNKRTCVPLPHVVSQPAHILIWANNIASTSPKSPA